MSLTGHCIDDRIGSRNECVSLVILALTVASFLLGFLRDLFIARSFGLSWEADLIFVALILPLFFENFLGTALRDTMIPTSRSYAASRSLCSNPSRAGSTGASCCSVAQPAR